ncbi:MAG: hypothetical protein WB821_10860 [Burkholderiaceae bacterium]
MQVLLDEAVPRALGFELTGHFVRTAQSQGFSSLSNGKLMKAMVDAGFEVLITFDQNLPYQQNERLPVAVVILVAPDNRLDTARLFVPQILQTLSTVRVGQLVRLAMS